MERAIKSIAPDAIDWEESSFEIRNFTADPCLETSLERCGVLHPPWVLAGGAGGKLIIVDGFKRLRWLKGRAAGACPVECFVYPAGTDRGELLLRRIETKLSGPPLNTAEKAGVAALLGELPGEEAAAAERLAAAGFAVRPGALAKWRRLALEGDVLLGAAASGEISERSALELAAWEDGDKGEALAALRELRCSASLQAEILERVSELAALENLGRADVLRAPESRAVLSHPEWNRRRKTQAFRDLLYRRRFPRLAAREERFSREAASAGLPGGVHLVPPPSFEGEKWQLQMVFTAPEELETLLEKAGDFARSPILPALMAPGGTPKEKAVGSKHLKERRT